MSMVYNANLKHSKNTNTYTLKIPTETVPRKKMCLGNQNGPQKQETSELIGESITFSSFDSMP